MMERLRRSRIVPALTCAWLLDPSMPTPLFAQDPGSGVTPVTAPADSSVSTRSVAPSLDQARELIKSGDYDRAIDVLKDAIEHSRTNETELRDAYLLLVKARVTYGNFLKSQPQGRPAAQLSYDEAKRTIADCLQTTALRHTHPEPASEYPPEMVDFFGEVRGRLFGAFRIVGLQPEGATVTFDARPLGVAPGDSVPGDVDLPVGSHRVVARANGHRDVSEEITISPHTTLERSYRLTRRRTTRWYAATAVGAAGVLGGIIAITAGKKETAKPAWQPLPQPPPPPSSR